MRKLLVVVGACLIALIVSAGPPPLVIVNVGLPDMNCFFNTNCTVIAHDSVSWLRIPGTTGQGIVQSRTYGGQPGAPLAAYQAYVYRVDLTGIQSSPLAPAYVQSLTVPFPSQIIAHDYNHDGITNDQVWVMTTGSGGTINLGSAVSTATNITFTFSPPVPCAIGTNAGKSSFYFGVTSTKTNESALGQVKVMEGTNLFSMTVTNFCPKP